MDLNTIQITISCMELKLNQSTKQVHGPQYNSDYNKLQGAQIQSKYKPVHGPQYNSAYKTVAWSSN